MGQLRLVPQYHWWKSSLLYADRIRPRKEVIWYVLVILPLLDPTCQPVAAVFYPFLILFNPLPTSDLDFTAPLGHPMMASTSRKAIVFLLMHLVLVLSQCFMVILWNHAPVEYTFHHHRSSLQLGRRPVTIFSRSSELPSLPRSKLKQMTDSFDSLKDSRHLVQHFVCNQQSEQGTSLRS